ncbi:hypothetical protein [Clostridium sp. DJ247]|uniref:hypothetical protein n=1 Tax=Clostridium sp. DJ247 TaxID=2726188 RepID=UPI0016259586|nr:hypothetical protein [Clostridium sp. DJ247]MBC2582844.1 hypothetical protein [Clostridium sp. DJ247]
MAKRPGSLVLTFSRKNTDIRNILENKKNTDNTFIVTDYICEAIRFYEKYKSSGEFYNLDQIKKLIDERLNSFIQVNRVNSILPADLPQSQRFIEEKITINELKTSINNLENDLDDIPIDED